MNIFQFLFAKEDYSSNDKLGAYPEKVHVSAMPERRYLKTTRFLALLSAGLLCSIIILSFILYMLSPQLRAEPLMLFIEKRLFRLEPVQRYVQPTPAIQLLLEAHVAEYVLLRNTIVPDIDEMRTRWDTRGRLMLFSFEKVATSFAPEKELKMRKMMEGMTVETKVRAVEALTDILWIVEFDTIEHMPEDENPVLKRWRALLEAGFFERPGFSKDERIANPLNFTVQKYFLSSRGISKEDAMARFQD